MNWKLILVSISFITSIDDNEYKYYFIKKILYKKQTSGINLKMCQN